jgi:hypothetical protein
MLPGLEFSGQGEILHNGRHLATVHYRVQTWRLASDDNGFPHGVQEAEPRGDLATRSIVMDAGAKLLPAGEICTLKVETGHECRVYLDPKGSGYYRISLVDISDLW